ncbi:MAG: SIS domain-containing protein [Erysipelotrichaceae bacterium]|nr:SIS domain-containing protein [Erysipelotrichaceae bacterium]
MIEQVFSTGYEVIRKIETTQMDALYQASEIIAKAIAEDHHFFVTGSGHSHTVAEEFYGRAGGLACMIPILTTELTLTEHPTKSTYLERLCGYASILADLYHVKEGDVVLIASNSGRNAYPVEMALEAHNRGAKVVAITNLKHSKATTSRHPSQKRLFEIADVVIDNCGEIGDAATKVDGIEAALLPTSSMANAFIAQAITVQVTCNLRDMGIEPPVFISSNVQSETNRNQEYFEKYTRIY